MEQLPPPTESLSMHKQMLYDLPRPEAPQVAFGIEAEHILLAARVIGNVATHAPDSLNTVAGYAQKANVYREEILCMAPLIEKLVRLEQITAEHVRPYRAVIKDIVRQESIGFRWAERAANFFSFFGINSPKRLLNTYVENKFIEKAPPAIAVAVDYVKNKVDMAMGLVAILVPAPKPESNESKKPDTWQGFMDASKTYIPAAYRQEVVSALSFARDVLASHESAEEDKGKTYDSPEAKVANKPRSSKESIVNWFRAKRINKQNRKNFSKA